MCTILILPIAKARGFCSRSNSSHPKARGTSLETNKTLSRCTLALIQIWASEADAFSFVHCRGLPHDSRPYPGIGCIPEVPSCLLASYSRLLFGQGKTGNPGAQAPYKDSPFIPMLKSRGLLARFGQPGFISLLRCGLPACALSAQMSLIAAQNPLIGNAPARVVRSACEE